MSRAAHTLANLALAVAIGAGLALALLHWIELEGLIGPGTVAHAALLALPAGGWLTRLMLRWRLALLRRELRYTLDEVVWLQEDRDVSIPEQLARYKRHARLLQARINTLEG